MNEITRPEPAAADTDFPAAHSMDTEWFAVDRDGHVARFYTGENGFAPTELPSWVVQSGSRSWGLADFLISHRAAADSTRPLRPLAELLALVDEMGYQRWATSTEGGIRISFPVFKPDDSKDRGLDQMLDLLGYQGQPPWRTEYLPQWPAFNIFLRVSSLEEVREEIAQGKAIPLSFPHADFAYFEELPLETVHRLVKRNACTGWFEAQQIEKELQTIGLYVYNYYEYSLPDNWLDLGYANDLAECLPYYRLEAPAVPNVPLRPLAELMILAGQQREDFLTNVCIQVNSLELVGLEVARGTAIPVSSFPSGFVFFQKVSLETVKHLENQKAGTGWFSVDLNDSVGAKFYRDLLENGTPATPVHIDELPAEAQPLLRAVRFDTLCFAQALHVQPFESLPRKIIGYGGLPRFFLSADLQTVCPVRGNEAAYREYYSRLVELAAKCGGRLRVKPPADIS